MARTYKIRRFANGRRKNGDPFINHSLTIPSHIAEQLPENMQFACELTEDGILFRPSPSESESVELPKWAKNGKGDSKPKAAPKKRQKPAAAKK